MTAAALSNDEQLHWLALKLVPGLGTRRSGQLVEQYRTPQAIFRASNSKLEARGIDTVAHKSALAAGGDTIAVFGCGVDNVYPAENRKLADELASKGLLLSEFAMAAPAYPQNFPVRNRIISGMSAGVLVVEGAQ